MADKEIKKSGVPASQASPSSDTPASSTPAAHYQQRGKLHCYNWLEDIPGGMADCDMVEVQFKNTRKGYYKNSTNIPLATGDIVAVEASPGHDIGQVTLTGKLVRNQMRKANIKPDAEIRRVFRKAKPADMEKFREAKAKENDTMIRSRQIAASLGLKMKIGDVEYQGDGNKAIFYYIADERVDFRQLIKVLAENFKVRIEMKQIGARQEAGRIGGIGPCGRPLCCASWMTNFVSVGTAAARFQDISLNPQKLAGQCAKLKCCLNFEVDAYVESVRKLPPKEARLETIDGTWYHFKTDIFKKLITYSSDKSVAANLTTIDARRAFEIIQMNKEGEKPAQLQREGEDKPKPKSDFIDLVGQDSINRFDKAKKKKRKPKANAPRNGNPDAAKPQPEKPGSDKAKADRPQRQGDKPKPDRQRSDKPRQKSRGQNQAKTGRQVKEQKPDDNHGGQRQAPDRTSRQPSAPKE